MTKVSKENLQKLKEQREKLNSRIQATEARLKTTDRKKDTRRKILLGSYYLDEAQKENKMDDLKQIMDKYLKRNSDRLLFELKLIAETEQG
jgi:large subunit ribosomal protein L7/L12